MRCRRKGTPRAAAVRTLRSTACALDGRADSGVVERCLQWLFRSRAQRWGQPTARAPEPTARADGGWPGNRSSGCARSPSATRAAESPQELQSVERPLALWAASGVVFVGKTNLAIFDGDQSSIRDRHAMGVARQVLQRDLGTAERRFGVDHPGFPFCGGQQASKVTLLGQVLKLAVKRQLALEESSP